MEATFSRKRRFRPWLLGMGVALTIRTSESFFVFQRFDSALVDKRLEDMYFVTTTEETDPGIIEDDSRHKQEDNIHKIPRMDPDWPVADVAAVESSHAESDLQPVEPVKRDIADPIISSTLDDDDEFEVERPRRWFQFWRWRRKPAAASETREKTSGKLSLLLSRAVEPPKERRYGARTITGLINALAEEVNDLDVEVISQKDSPFWRKNVDNITIQFSRLAFQPLRLVGKAEVVTTPKRNRWWNLRGRNETLIMSPDETFDRLDVDNSGALDKEEIADALSEAAGDVPSASESDNNKRYKVLQKLASELIKLYDANGDGVVDRDEYRTMVQDMASLKLAQTRETVTSSVSEFVTSAKTLAGESMSRLGLTSRGNQTTNITEGEEASVAAREELLHELESVNITDVPLVPRSGKGTKSLGSVTFSNLKVDMRRLVFGAIPILKHLVPGGPLVLEPFMVNVTGAVTPADAMNSPLVDAGLRQLVARALRRRVGSLRDFLEGAVWYGRSFKLISGTGPVVQVPKLTSVELDDVGRLIITGRARVRDRPDGQAIENGFKVRTRIGTRQDGRVIRLVEPELALVVECPKRLEQWIDTCCGFLDLPKPERPKPIYSFFPIYSPFKVDDNDGFDLGEDNCINSIYVEDGVLNFEVSSAIRPGKFLGNHYVAFTVPIRTFIVTLDRMRAGIRAARRAKKASREKAEPKQETKGDTAQQPRGFFTRFLDGYLQTEREASEKEQMTNAIREFFGNQHGKHNETLLLEGARFV